VLLCNSAEDTAKQSAYLEVMAAERVMGVLISPAADGDAAISRLMDLGIPIVAFDRPVADPRAMPW
ncbi:transcriptional regulator, LacI family, partial [mine drainage metagenome]